MRRALVTALAVPVLLLSACGSDEPEVEDATTSETEEATEEAPATEEPTDAAPTTEAPADDEVTEPPTDAAPTTEAPTTEAPVDDGEATAAPSDDADATQAPGAGGEVEGGADGQAAADRTKEWLVAFVNGEEAVCDMMLDLDSEGPMVDNQAHYDVCVSTLPTQAETMLGDAPELPGIIESMELQGADVQGDVAVVDKDNFSPLFAEGMGSQVITLQKIDGEWLVDMNESFN